MHKLPSSTVKLISSTQVITSIYSVVKELLENSLDAGADSIDIRLDKGGLDKIEIQDNGTGISTIDIEFLCKPHYTSKIKDDSDLLNLSSYGFRGEAVHSLCMVAEVTVITKTKDDYVSQLYTFDKQGDIAKCKPTHHNIGTIVSVIHLFKDIPVRRQLYNKPKKIKEELNCIEKLLMSYGLCHPKLRLTLANDKNIIWRKNRTSDYIYTHTISEVFGPKVRDNFAELDTVGMNFEVKLFVPKKNCDFEVMTRAHSDHVFIFVNSRPVVMKEIKKLVKHHFNASHSLASNRWPMVVLYIKVKPHLVDVNLEPNKTNILLLNMEEIMDKIRIMLESLYEKCHQEEVSILDEEPTQSSDEHLIAPVHDRNTVDKNTISTHVEGHLCDTVSSETNYKSTQELADDFFGEENLSESSNNDVSQTTDCTDLQISQIPYCHAEQLVQISKDKKSTNEIKDQISLTVDHEQCFGTDPGVIDELSIKCHKGPNKENTQKVGEFDMEEWSRGNADLEICTPIKVLQKNTNDASMKKRKQLDHTPAIKKVKRESAVPKLMDNKKVKDIEKLFKKSNNYEDESCSFQFNRIQEKFSSRKTESLRNKTIHAVGKIPNSNSLWAVVIGHKLFIVDKARLAEKLIYEKLLRSHKFHVEKLLHPVLLTNNNLGAVYLKYLNNIKEDVSINDGIGRAISYPPFTDNGILIKRSTDTKTGENILEWTHSASKIPNYNLDDLVTILEEAKENEHYRPEKVKEWSKREAKLLSQSCPEVCSSEEIEESILELKKQCGERNFEVEVCLHNRPIMVPVKSMKFM